MKPDKNYLDKIKYSLFGSGPYGLWFNLVSLEPLMPVWVYYDGHYADWLGLVTTILLQPSLWFGLV